MSERRWKVIEGGHAFFSLDDIIVLSTDDGTVSPFFKKRGYSDGFAFFLKWLVEIDADGNTIRTYKEGDTLEGGTLVQREEKMEGLDVVFARAEKAIAGSLDFYSGSFVRGILRPLVDEIGNLRDKLAAVHDVWEKARPDEAYAEINFFADRFSIASGGRHIERYTRDLPKTIEQEVKDAVKEKYSGTMVSIDAIITDTMAMYKARTEVKQ